ncbi:neutral/alkaline non-lysosomal ceramidase N-terminal domain-containing protein [Siphonobacter aquaeclarae]|uniref:Neutral/alkaline non-lysosomal ceramidase, N-terminal n=1 Tax=Siphonobacter aquaeclarae TaxID=563176 RepID=A0A1G9Q9A4_9BACT|nr:neutral/alkaline non-lysosomal ceramidase N-terminal domain-containing protein [Siphonobacter aquaeclarae]SDM07047.1 Neutral/alkaline non-lysosomal ceramidase, N-terminal [Siphonobacter aquaeclarae]
MKFLRILTKTCLILIALILVLLVSTLTTVDETPYAGSEAEAVTNTHLQKVTAALAQQRPDPLRDKPLQIGWARTNITPSEPTPLAGYGTRRGKVSTAVRDSLYVRAFVFDNGQRRTAIVATDLLIVPPTIVEAVRQHWPKHLTLQADQLYFGAIHSHNSEGGWQEGLGSEMIAGDYNPEVVAFLARRTIEALTAAEANLEPAEIGYGEAALPDYIENRLVGTEGIVDPMVRMIKLKKQSGATALLVTYAAHATLINDENLVVSRDYPGVLVDSLEKQQVDFAAFMAGGVGSMRPHVKSGTDDQEMNEEAQALNRKIREVLPGIATSPTSSLAFATLPVELRQPQLQVAKGWKVRQWAWDLLFGKETADIKVLRIGDIALLGMPADFSGELVPEFRSRLHVVVTSFNGHYIGYVTPDKYWTRDTYESVVMNWFGPNTGSYLVKAGQALLNAL